jgi:hypothetical protein
MKDLIQFETEAEANAYAHKANYKFSTNTDLCPVIVTTCAGFDCASAAESEVRNGFHGNFHVTPAHCRNPMVTGIFIAKREE